MDINPDWTLVVLSLFPFLVALIVAWRVLFVPLMQHLEERRSHGEGAQEDADHMAADVDAKVEEIDGRIKALRVELADQRNEHRARANADRNQVLEQARAEAEQQVSEALKTIEAEREVAAKALRDSAQALSTDIVAQVLGRSVEA